jgi:hypothetical protein
MDEAVWIETTDGGLLRQLFGHYPTLHNSRLTSLEVDRKRDCVFAEIEYCDEPEAGEAVLRVRIRLEWYGIHSMDFWFQGAEIMAVSFDKVGSLLATRFAPCSGAQGSIVAERFEAFLTQANALPSDSEGVILRMR